MLDLRLSKYFLKKENAAKLIEHIKANPGCCDGVWINSLYGYPKIEAVRKAVENMKEVKKLFTDAGIKVSLQISNTLGHSAGHMSSYDYSGLVFEGTPVERMVGEYGEMSYGCYCPSGEFFRNYIYETTKMYAEIDPVCVWVDDDLRIYNHAPVNHGCFCDECIERFNKKHGTSYTRESLVHEINRGDIAVREAYIEHNRESIRGLTSIISKAVHESAPNARMAYQSSRTNSFLGKDFNCIFDAMYEESGNKPVGYRPGGGFYEDAAPRGMLSKALHLDCAIAVVPDYVEDICPEIECLPDVYFGKSLEGTAKEISLYLAYGCNCISVASPNHGSECDEYNGDLMRWFAKYSDFWQKTIEHNGRSKCSGVGIYLSPEAYKRPLADDEKDFEWDKIRFAYENIALMSVGVPVTNNFKDCPVILLYEEAAKGLLDNEIKELVKKPVICTAKALAILCERGYGAYFGASVEKLDTTSGIEVYTDHPINGKYAGKRWRASGFHSPAGVVMAQSIIDKDGKTQVFGTLSNMITEEDYGPTNAIVNTYDKDGNAAAKWAVFGYALFERVMSSVKRDQILNAIDYICENKMPAVIKTPDQVSVIPRVDGEGKTVSVAVQSISIGETGEQKLLIRNPVGEKIAYMSAKKAYTKIGFEKIDDGYLVKLPALEPYEMITVFCNK